MNLFNPVTSEAKNETLFYSLYYIIFIIHLLFLSPLFRIHLLAFRCFIQFFMAQSIFSLFIILISFWVSLCFYAVQYHYFVLHFC